MLGKKSAVDWWYASGKTCYLLASIKIADICVQRATLQNKAS